MLKYFACIDVCVPCGCLLSKQVRKGIWSPGTGMVVSFLVDAGNLTQVRCKNKCSKGIRVSLLNSKDIVIQQRENAQRLRALYLFSLFYCFIDLYIFSVPLYSSSLPVYPVLWPAYFQFLVFVFLKRSYLFHLPIKVYVCLSQGLLCSLGPVGLLVVGWFFFPLCLKPIYECLHTIFFILGLGYLTHYGFF